MLPLKLPSTLSTCKSSVAARVFNSKKMIEDISGVSVSMEGDSMEHSSLSLTVLEIFILMKTHLSNFHMT